MKLTTFAQHYKNNHHAFYLDDIVRAIEPNPLVSAAKLLDDLAKESQLREQEAINWLLDDAIKASQPTWASSLDAIKASQPTPWEQAFSPYDAFKASLTFSPYDAINKALKDTDDSIAKSIARKIKKITSKGFCAVKKVATRFLRNLRRYKEVLFVKSDFVDRLIDALEQIITKLSVFSLGVKTMLIEPVKDYLYQKKSQTNDLRQTSVIMMLDSNRTPNTPANDSQSKLTA